MNNSLNLITRTNKTFQTIISLCFICFIACTSNKNLKTDIPTVRLAPEEAGTLKVSDFFESYKLYEFKDYLFSGISDFIELGNKRIAIINFYGMAQSTLPSQLAIFDISGHFLYQIGKNGRGPGEHLDLSSPIIIRKDSSLDIIDLNGTKYLNYTLNNKLNREQLSLYTRDSGIPQLWFNDSLLLTTKEVQYKDFQLQAQPLYNVYLYYPTKHIIHKKYLSTDQSLKDYNIRTKRPYKINDTICIYSEKDACIFNILADTITPRYYFDKGKHDGFITNKDFFKGNINNNYILYINSFENNQYLFGNYYYNQRYYYFIYDKKKDITYNYKNVNENIVFRNKKEHGIWPSQSLFFNINSLQADDKYLYVVYSQNEFRNLVETTQKALSPEDWQTYRQTHQDILTAYENYDEETCNPVIIGFKYR